MTEREQEWADFSRDNEISRVLALSSRRFFLEDLQTPYVVTSIRTVASRPWKCVQNPIEIALENSASTARLFFSEYDEKIEINKCINFFKQKV